MYVFYKIHQQNIVPFYWLVIGAVCLQFTQLARSLGHLATRQVSLYQVFLTGKLRIWQPTFLTFKNKIL